MEEYTPRLQSAEVDDVLRTILKLHDLSECYRFFEDICTVAELQSIAQRWEVAKQLDAGITYQDISHSLNASTATISRVNRSLAYGSGGYRLMLDRINNEG
ncbi:MAG: YerC/YecD family TrpR-related protein [Clostridia bacterium]